jgi:DNA-directed RNA polymerase specialized sigma24 family protein
VPFTWPAIHEHLRRSASTLGFQHDFDLFRLRRTLISRFRDPAGLLDILHRGSALPDQKSDVLRVLIVEAQSGEPEADSALTLMLLALWPGLDAIRRRVIRRGVTKVDEVGSEVIARATEAIRCLDLQRVNRIAATVVRNIERDLMRAYRQEVDRQRRSAEIDPDELAVDGYAPTPGELYREVARLVGGNDATLIIRVAVEGCSQAEIAVELRLSEAATRKRYQRTIRRLRDALKEFA